MKKNKYIYLITGIFLFLINYSVSAQYDFILKERKLTDEYIGIVPVDEGLNLLLKDPCNFGCEEDIANFSFNWGNSFNTAVNNETLLSIARDKARRDWFENQKKLVKENIENKLNENFANYDEAKNALFLSSESINLSNNKKLPISQYRSRRLNGFNKTKALSKELLLLKKRKLEIQSGNINNSFFEGFKVNSIDLKDLKSVSSINLNWNKIENLLSENLATTFVDNDIYNKLNSLGIEFNNEIIRLKNNYYNSFDEWEQLNLIQFLLNYEEYKKIADCFMCFPNNPFYKFHDIDITTTNVIEEYAINNRGGGYSFFSEIGRDAYIGWPSSSSHSLAIIKRQEYEKEKEKRLNALLEEYSVFNSKDIDFLVFVFNNSNSSEQEWLNYNPNRAKEMANYLLSLFHNSQQYASYIYNRDVKPEIEAGGELVELVENLSDRLGNLNAFGKRHLVFTPNAISNVNSFISDNNTSKAKDFAKQAINIFGSYNSESEKRKQFIEAYDIYDPLLSNNLSQIGYEGQIRQYALEFRRRGKVEFADYLESLLPFTSNMKMGEIYDLYDVIRKEKLNLFYDYFRSITIATAQSFVPVVKVALLSAGGGLALRILSRLPSAYVTVHISSIIARLGIPASTAYSTFLHAQKYGIQTFLQLQEQFVNLGLTRTVEGVQFHHLIEQRFAGNTAIQNWLGSSTGNWQSIVLTPEEHQVFTNAWRAAISTINMNNPGWTGAYTNTATLEQVKQAARQIYANYPEILNALGL